MFKSLLIDKPAFSYHPGHDINIALNHLDWPDNITNATGGELKLHHDAQVQKKDDIKDPMGYFTTEIWIFTYEVPSNFSGLGS